MAKHNSTTFFGASVSEPRPAPPCDVAGASAPICTFAQTPKSGDGMGGL